MQRLKKQECNDAEKQQDGKCLGYSIWNDDEPIEQCKNCKNNSTYDAKKTNKTSILKWRVL